MSVDAFIFKFIKQVRAIKKYKFVQYLRCALISEKARKKNPIKGILVLHAQKKLR